MFGVRGHKEKPRAQGEDREGGGGDEGHASLEQPRRDQEQQNDRQGSGTQQSEVNARAGLPEDGEHEGVEGVDARHLEVVRLRIRRDALEQQLAEIRILALVAIQGCVQKA